MMKTKIESIWERLLGESNPDGGDHKLGKIVRVEESHPFNLYAGIDEDGRLLLALNLIERPQSVQMKSDAFHCFRQRRIDDTWFFVLALEKPMLAPVFGRLCQDLIDTAWTTPSEKDLEHLFVERLLLWKRLFDMDSDGLLDESKLKGLIGELWVFKDLIDKSSHNQMTVTESWVGPMRAPQDFQFDGMAIEVKCVSQNNPVVRISSLEQLDCVNQLTLSVLKLNKLNIDTPSSINVNSLVAEIEGRLDLPALKMFQSKLLEAGYVENSHYDSMKYEVVDFIEYRVTDGFPKLTHDNVANGILEAGYTVSFESIESFRG